MLMTKQEAKLMAQQKDGANNSKHDIMQDNNKAIAKSKYIERCKASETETVNGK